eukprot:3512931-Amphidinium_carterae.1
MELLRSEPQASQRCCGSETMCCIFRSPLFGCFMLYQDPKAFKSLPDELRLAPAASKAIDRTISVPISFVLPLASLGDEVDCFRPI